MTDQLEQRIKNLSPEKLALLAHDVLRREQAVREPIAIVGVAGRFPCGADNPQQLYERLCQGADLRTTVPAQRWNEAAFYDANPQRFGKSYTRHGYFISDVEQFDAGFFGLSPREAKAMDPQQRLLLECVWEALEDTGRSPAAFEGTRTGVFIGSYADEYLHLQVWSGALDAIDAHTGTGTSHSASVGRVSHLLGLNGPCMALDTACSSSLVAVHLACQSLRRKECDAALAGGVSLMLSPESTISLSRSGMLSSDGRCKTFDARADGFGRGEGCGVVVLKRLSDAVNDGDRVLALVRGSAVNHDGRASSLTAPNGPAQVDVLRRALADAGLSPNQLDYVEAHGTGTPLGDPIEVQALAEVFAGREQALGIGSIKTNIGHLEAAAGISGLIKIVLSLQAEKLPGQLHFDAANPHLGIENSPLEVVAATRPWPRTDRVRAAGVSSFGFGGTNAHVILCEAPGPLKSTAESHEVADQDEGTSMMALSARSEQELQALAARFETHLTSTRDHWRDIAYTANTGRVHHHHRLVVEASTKTEARDALARFAERRQDGWKQGVARSAPGPVFLYPGQGAQYPGMGKELYARNRVFRDALDECEQLLRKHDVPLIEILYGTQSERIDSTAYTQPALFCVEWALTQTWRHWGINPAAVLGHSIGEYVAACVAGVLELDDALALVVKRAQLMQSLPAGGGMAAVMADEDTVRAALEGTNLSVAAINGPRNTVVSGAINELERVLDHLDQVPTQRLTVSHAFHSTLLEPILNEFECFVEQLPLRRPQLPLISNRDGAVVDEELTQARYWREHLRHEVRFADGIHTALSHGYDTFLEVGPGTALTSMGKRCAAEQPCTWLSSLRRSQVDLLQFRESLAELYLKGADVNWAEVQSVNLDGKQTGAVAARPGRRVSLPTYPFNRQRLFTSSVRRGRERMLQAVNEDSQTHALIGRRLSLAGQEVVFETHFDAEQPSFLSDHCLFEQVVVPGANHAVMLLAAAQLVFPERTLALTDVLFPAPLVLAEGVQRQVQVVVHPDGHARVASAASSDAGAFTTHAIARLSESGEQPSELEAFSAGLQDAESLASEVFYSKMAELGFVLGPHFQWLQDLEIADGIARATFRASDDTESITPLFPGFLDACFQLVAAAHAGTGVQQSESLFVPMAIERVVLTGDCHGALSGVARLTERSDTDIVADINIRNQAGECVLMITGLRARPLAAQALRSQSPVVHPLYEVMWRPVPTQPVQPSGRWLVVGQDAETRDVVDAFDHAGVRAERLRLPEVEANTSGVEQQGQVNLTDPVQVKRAVAKAVSDALIDGVLYVTPVDDDGRPGNDADSPSESQAEPPERAVTAALHLVQALAGHSTRLWCLTRRTHDRFGTEGAAAALWGFGRVLALEEPSLWGGMLEASDTASLSSALAALASEHDMVGVSGEGWHVPRLTRVSKGEPWKAPVVHADAAYLITGGLGALGLHVAQWLISRGARCLVLLGRNGLPSEQGNSAKQERVDALREQGVRVEIMTCDVSSRAQVESVLREVKTSLPPLRGMFHCAGILDDGIIQQQNAERFKRVMAPKVRGAWNLHAATRELQLDHFVLFSSAAAILGSPGQAGYAAANACLDALARQRVAQGLPAMSIGWGPWADAGMAAESLGTTHAELVRPMTPALAIDCMERVLDGQQGHIAVVDVAFDMWSQVTGNRSAFLSEVLPVRTSAAPTVAFLARAELDALPDGERAAHLQRALRQELARVLQTSADTIDPDVSLHALGLDSLMSIELKNRMEHGLGVSLPVTDLIKGPSLIQLAAILEAALEPTKLVSEPEHAVASQELSGLNDFQVDALLMDILQEQNS